MYFNHQRKVYGALCKSRLAVVLNGKFIIVNSRETRTIHVHIHICMYPWIYKYM